MSDPDPAAGETRWEQLQRWRAEGLPREQWLERLLASGLDAESARVLVNSIDGVTPAVLPEASFAPGVNPLAPGRFAVTDLGLTGDRVTVGAYWMAFGAAIGLLWGVFSLLVWLDLVEERAALVDLLARVAAGVGGVAFAFGAWKVVTGVRVRRR